MDTLLLSEHHVRIESRIAPPCKRTPHRAPGDGAARDSTDSAPVLVANARGSVEAVAEVSDRVRPSVTATTTGG
jgi:hypothetical protein